MKQQRLSPCLLFLLGFCGLILRFPLAQVAAEETPKPSATPAATAAAGISPTPTPRVRWVGVHTGKEERHKWETNAQRGDKIWVDIINFKDWVNHLEKKPDKPSGRISYFISIIFRSRALPHFTLMKQSGKRETLPAKLRVQQLVFPLSAMTSRSWGGRTYSTNRSSSAE